MVSRFVVHSRPVQGPATHAIVIGVGRYPHLRGGDGRLTPNHEGMGQLSSPPISARAVARWLIRSLHDPRKPLADVALLLSEDNPAPFRNPRTGVTTDVAPATIDCIDEALNEWHTRGDAGEDHRLIFYFCGHGLGRGSAVTLLAADYGVNPRMPLDGAIDLHYFVQGMDWCLAREQLYFVDACRTVSESLIHAGQVNGRAIFQTLVDTPTGADRRAPVFYSTLAGAEAFGRARRPSPFTEALIRGLQGAGADDSDGGWRVTTNKLKEALDFFLERATRGLGRAQVPAADNQAPITMHFVRGSPKGTAIVSCEPVEAMGTAALSCVAGGKVRTRPDRGGDEWVLELPEGTYEFVAEFDHGPFRSDRSPAYVRPVYRRIQLRVRP